MPPGVDVYNTSYGNYEWDVYRDVRLETYGEDYGQTSWVTTEESHEIPRLLELTPGCSVLEIGSGSGRYALYVAETARCQVVGLDVNAEGVRSASALAKRQNLSAQLRFQLCDVSQPLPFADASFDALYSNDVFCHIPGRLSLAAGAVARAEAGRPNDFQRCSGGRWNAFQPGDRDPQPDRLLPVRPSGGK
jgi:SAM-dependent methyltransferase